jgi:hypothetical protein
MSAVLQLAVCCSLQISIGELWGSLKLACPVLLLRRMKSSSKLLLILTAATAFFLAQPVKAGHTIQGGPTVANVPDAGSTISLLGFALFGVVALRRKLSR